MSSKEVTLIQSTFSPASPDATSPADSVPVTVFDATSATVDRANNHHRKNSTAQCAAEDDSASIVTEKAANFDINKMQPSSSSSSLKE